MFSPRILPALAIVLSVVTTLVAQGDAADEKKGNENQPVSYYTDVRPILAEHCQGCHQPAKAKGEFVLTSYAGLMKGAEDGEEIVVIPGKPGKSHLIDEIISRDGKPPKMPKKAPPLHASQVETIRRWIAEGAKDDTPDTVKVQFSMENPPTYQTLPVLTSLDFSPDGSKLAVSGYHEVLILKADDATVLTRLVGLSERIESAVFSPDGKHLAVTGGSPCRFGEVQIWDVEKSKLLSSVSVTYDTLYGASWSHDGKLVAFGCADNSVRVIEATTGKQVLFNGAHGDWVLSTVFSKDSSHLITVSRDRSMKLMQVKTEQFIDNITSITPGALKGGLMAVDRHPAKDELLIGGADGVPKIYRTYREKARKIGDDYNLIRKFEKSPGRVFSVRFSKDGNRIVAGSSHDGNGEVRVYQSGDGKKLVSLEFDGAIYTVDFSPDGKTVVAGGFAGKVWLIDVEKSKVSKEFIPVPLTVAASATKAGS